MGNATQYGKAVPEEERPDGLLWGYGALFAAAAFAAHLRNESRDEPTLAGDAFSGVLAGLAMLAKFSGAIACLAIGALTGLRWLRSGNARGRFPRIAIRALAVGALLVLIAAPYYGRNVGEFGTPFMTSAAVHDVARVQAVQHVENLRAHLGGIDVLLLGGVCQRGRHE